MVIFVAFCSIGFGSGFFARSGDNLVDATFHVEIALGNVIEFAVEDHLEAADCILDRHVLAGRAGENRSI